MTSATRDGRQAPLGVDNERLYQRFTPLGFFRFPLVTILCMWLSHIIELYVMKEIKKTKKKNLYQASKIILYI